MGDSESVEVEDGYSSREKTTQWLESILQIYYTYIKRQSRPEAERSNIQPVDVTVIEFDIGPGYAADSRLSTLSDLLAIKVAFKIDNEPEKTEYLMVKIPPNDLADREMAHLAQVDKREIHFYTEALVQMQEFIASRQADIILSVPKCYFAKYHKQDSPDENEDGLGFAEAESVLVLEDIRPTGYSMRDCTAGLTLLETKAALREIAIFHSVSWAMQEVTGFQLHRKWDFSYRPEKAASAYKTLVEQGFPTLAGFLEKQEPDGADLLARLKTLHPRAADLLFELLEPPLPPLPSSLTHMDFWCNNLLFRTSSDNQNSGDGEMEPPECQIVDWQMMTISRPTHDVALLLFSSLTPELRQESTTELLQYYWTAFQDTARKLNVDLPFDFACLESEFQRSQLLALLLVIGSIDLALDTEATETRLMSALRDIAKGGLL